LKGATIKSVNVLSFWRSNDKIKKENYGPYDDDTVNGEEQPEEVKSDGGVKIKDEDTDNE